MVPGRLAEIVHAATIKEMQKLVTELLIVQRTVPCLDRGIRVLDNANLPAERDPVLWFLPKSQQCKVYPIEGEDVEVILVPRE